MARTSRDYAALVSPSYLDDKLVERASPPEAVDSLIRCLGASPEDSGQGAIVARSSWRSSADGTVELEAGGTVPVRMGDVVALPLGYHRWHDSAGVRELIVTPRSCVIPQHRAAVLSVQLYGARSSRSWGIGDYSDLQALSRWALRHGIAHVLANPMYACAPTYPQEDCPYAPASRLFGNPLYLRPEDVPTADVTDLSDLAAAARALNRASRVDRDAVWRLKQAALRRIFDSGPLTEFDDWLTNQPPELHRFGVWCVLAERYGADTRGWPSVYRGARNPRVQEFAVEHGDSVRFYEWLQWLLRRQPATDGATVIRDLPVGVRVGGADQWIWPEAFVSGATIGAPPDALNTTGQGWGLAPLHPGQLRRHGFRPFVNYLREAMADSAGLRIDHVLGLSRMWMIPDGAPPDHGAYVRYPVDDLLGILALESHRSGAFVVGEDLGTVEPGVRDALASAGVLSSRVLVVDDENPTQWPARSLATVSTHDLPTIAGLVSGTDLEDLRRAGVPGADHVDTIVRARVTRHIGASHDPAQNVRLAQEALRSSPSRLVGVSMEDLLHVAHRPNIPATEWRWNWTRPLPIPIDELDAVSDASTLPDLRDNRG